MSVWSMNTLKYTDTVRHTTPADVVLVGGSSQGKQGRGTGLPLRRGVTVGCGSGFLGCPPQGLPRRGHVSERVQRVNCLDCVWPCLCSNTLEISLVCLNIYRSFNEVFAIS